MRYQLILFAILAFRVLAIVLLFLIHPLVAIAINIAGDAIDGPIYDYVLKFGKLKNQMYDKVLDFAYYIGLMIVVLQLTLPFSQLLFILFVYRTIGQFVFFTTKDKRYFTLFPNFFEYFTIGVLIVEFINPADTFVRFLITMALFAVMTGFKLWNENFLHRENKTMFQTFWIPVFKRLGFRFAYALQRTY